MSSLAFDTAKFFLGKLCCNGHEWESSGKGLRRISNKSCVECSLKASNNYYKNNREYVLKRTKIYREANPEKIKERKRKDYIKNRQHVLERVRKYARTENGKLTARKSKSRRRAREKAIHRVPYSHKSLKALQALFDNTCAYCGKSPATSFDHYIPIIKGGTDTLSNLLPCCCTCNSRKMHYDAELWYQQQTFFSKSRWRKIQQHLGKRVCNGQLTLF